MRQTKKIDFSKMQQNKNQKILKALEKPYNDNTENFPFMLHFCHHRWEIDFCK